MKPKKGMDKEEAFRSGYVALIGLPNVGKSTLMNRILGEKISIVTDKPQTTRNRILGVKTTEKYQIIFLDTPGIHRPKHRLNEIMMKTSFATLEDADLILFLVDPKKKIGEGEHFVLQKLKQVKRAVILVINKIDLVNKEELLPMIDGYKNLMEFQEVIPLSALNGDGVSDLEGLISSYLLPGPPFFPEESVTDLSERFMIAEIIREKMIVLTRNEIPYSVTAMVEKVKKRPGKDLIDVDAVIYTEKDSQKGIIIGNKGKMLKEIGRSARPEIEELLGSKVFLSLWVKVRKDWRSHLRMLKELGFE